MGKQKQQAISRFFQPQSGAGSPPSSPPFQSSSPLQATSTRSPRITSTVFFSPSKRRLASQFASSSPEKIRKLFPHADCSSLHQRFLQKFLEPHEQTPNCSRRLDSSLSNIQLSEPKDNAKYTPLEQQVLELKGKHPDVLLMVEVGYKFKFFGKDAEVAADVLGIYAHVDHNFMTASVPTFRLSVHVRRLVNSGYKVGVVKQTETAAIKAHGSNRLGPFCRGLSALYTKATLEAADGLGDGGEGYGGSSNYLACITETEAVEKNPNCSVEGSFDVRIGIVAVEISTGEVVHTEFNDTFMRSGLEGVILGLTPVELLIGMPISKLTEKTLLSYAVSISHVRVERIFSDSFNDGRALTEVSFLYENIRADGGGTNHQGGYSVDSEHENQPSTVGGTMGSLAVKALAMVFHHLKQFGMERILSLGASFRPFSSSTEMTLSGNALHQLEVLKNSDGSDSSGSLLQTMDHTLTVFGSRLLRHWVSHPLCDRNMICSRLDAVSEIAESMGYSNRASDSFPSTTDGNETPTSRPADLYTSLSSVLTSLGRSPDIQRGITRIFHRTATASEFTAVVQALLSAAKNLRHLHARPNSSLLRKLISASSSPTLTGTAAKLLNLLNKEAASRGDLLNLFHNPEAKFPEVASAQSSVQAARQKLDSLIITYRHQLRMKNLEFTTVSGTTHLIELLSDAAVPRDWVKVSSTKKTVRYHTPGVIAALDDFTLATDHLTISARAAWETFLTDFAPHYSDFHAAVLSLASLDCLRSLAVLSRNKNYVRPVLLDDDHPAQIQICSGRHPVLETVLDGAFVPNDTLLHADAEYCQVITGPNMGGKSCYLRQVALLVLMAQVGSFVPAESATMHVVDGIHTRMGASDSIETGRSSFMEELSGAAAVLSGCTSRSLVIVDELGRGTSTHDGAAVAYAALHHLVGRSRCPTLFVTHYPGIVADVRSDFPGSVAPYHVSYLVSGPHRREDITYLYKLLPGISSRSFGFKVARLAQLPRSCIDRGSGMAEAMEAAAVKRGAGICEYREFFRLLKCTVTGEGGDASPALLTLKTLAQRLSAAAFSPISFP